MQCAVRRPLPLLLWVAIPMLVTAAVLGLTSLGELLLGLPGETVVTSAHLGSSAAITLVVGYSVAWPDRWHWLRWPYPAAVFVSGVALHGVILPAIVSLTLGIPSAAALLHVVSVHRYPRRPLPP